jgi:hypothetical protein
MKHEIGLFFCSRAEKSYFITRAPPPPPPGRTRNKSALFSTRKKTVKKSFTFFIELIVIATMQMKIVVVLAFCSTEAAAESERDGCRTNVPRCTTMRRKSASS